MSDTPRTDKLSAMVQNQNWGFRDMQLLAQKLETELKECQVALQAVSDRKTIGDELNARRLVSGALAKLREAAQ